MILIPINDIFYFSDRRGGMGGPGGMSFLQNVTDAARTQFFNIMNNGMNMTMTQIRSAEQSWADTNGVRVSCLILQTIVFMKIMTVVRTYWYRHAETYKILRILNEKSCHTFPIVLG